MCREIVDCCYSITMIEEVEGLASDPADWLASHAEPHGLTTLLAHADDGVIWGQMVKGQLLLSGEAFPDLSPDLREPTLNQARLFGKGAELLAWRGGDGEWHARLLSDGGAGTEGECFDEAHLLWGDHQEGDEAAGFTPIADGQQGLRHAVPLPSREIPFGPPGYRPLRLGTRHYLEQDDDGMLAVIHSRLVSLGFERRREESNA